MGPPGRTGAGTPLHHHRRDLHDAMPLLRKLKSADGRSAELKVLSAECSPTRSDSALLTQHFQLALNGTNLTGSSCRRTSFPLIRRTSHKYCAWPPTG